MADNVKPLSTAPGKLSTCPGRLRKSFRSIPPTPRISAVLGPKTPCGISRTDDYPPSITGKPALSYRDDPEKFIALHPDLVLVRPMIERSYPQFIDKLNQAGIAVISLQPNSVEEMFDYWQNLGILTGHEVQAKEMIAVFKSRLKVVAGQVERYSWPTGGRKSTSSQSIIK